MTTWWTVMLAKHMGLSPKEINEMPLYKVLLYTHCINITEGVNTRWEHLDASTPVVKLEDINSFIQEI